LKLLAELEQTRRGPRPGGPGRRRRQSVRRSRAESR
jgi:hypothetical protein